MSYRVGGVAVLPPAHRMHRSSEFSSVVRGGDRFGARTLVVHHRAQLAVEPSSVPTAARPALVGLVVSKAVGNSVVRHRVSRRLRAVLSARLDLLASGSGTVVRALPAAASAPSDMLAADLERALARRASRS